MKTFSTTAGITITAFIVSVFYFMPILGQEKIPEEKTKIRFFIKNFGVTIDGIFAPFETTYYCNPKKISDSYINLKIPVKNVSTGNKMRDKDLLSDKFFNEGRYPFILFTSTEVNKISADEYRIKGKLTIKGVTKEIIVPLKVSFKDESNGYMLLKAIVKINRNDFGVGTDYWLAQSCIGKTVTVESEIKVSLEN